jgi:two-component system, OmpR family, phosphate regulon sensor histidine kinase PhoR
MPNTIKSRSLTLFYILVGYVVAQLLWWAIHIIQLTSQIYQEDEYLQRRIWMIAGEGIVFFTLLSIGVYKIRKNFRQEVKLAQQKQNFALSVTHELKSPIAGIKLFLQTLQKHDLPEEKRKDIVNKCLQNTNRLESLINNILLTNAFENGNYQLLKEAFDAKSTAQEIIFLLSSANNKSNIQFTFSGDETIVADKQSFTSILSNLLENAIKYSEENSSIDVEISTSKNNISLKIKDQGIGISESERYLIFDKFYRAGNELTRKTKGTGLGLFIVYELVHLNEGDIRVEANLPKGTVFTVYLPINEKFSSQ